MTVQVSANARVATIPGNVAPRSVVMITRFIFASLIRITELTLSKRPLQ